MSIRDAIKVFGINIVCLLLMFFGVAGFLKFEHTSNAFMIALCIVAVIVGFLAAVSSNIKMFTKKPDVVINDMTDKELINMLEKCTSKGCVQNRNAAESMIRQLQTFTSRKKVLLNLLNDYFSDDDNLYAYTNLIEKANNTLKDNIDAAVKRITIFDDQEYNLLKENKGVYSPEIRKSKLDQYEEHLKYIEKMVNSNDVLIIEFDNLITEVSRLNESDDANDLSLLKDTVNAMKQLHFSEDEQLDGLMNKY